MEKESAAICENIAIDLIRRAHEVPDRIGLIFEDGRSLTYSQWADRAGRIATALSTHGVTRGDRVALYLQNSLDLACSLHGCWLIGAVPITLSVMYNDSELEGSLVKTNPVAVMTHASCLASVEKVAERQPRQWQKIVIVAPEPDGSTPSFSASSNLTCYSLTEIIEGVPPVREPIEVTEDDEGTIVFTGGTTGLPKAVTMTHAGTRISLTTLARVSKKGVAGPYEAVPESVGPNLLALPLFHSGGQQAYLFALFVGRSLAIMERFRPTTLARLVAEYKIDNLFLMPTMLYDIVHSKEHVELPTLKSVLIAGQALDPGLKQEFETGWNIPILSNYGSTEIGHVAGWTSADLKANRWKAGPVGRIYDGVDVEIRDEEGKVLPNGSEGEIWVRNGTTKGYVDASGGGVEALIIDGWVGSGDVGYIDDDRNLYLVGRKRDMIKTGGFQIWPQEIEIVLREHELVADVAVVGVPDARMGEIPKAFVVLADGVTVTVDDLREKLVDYCRERLAHFKMIRDVAIVGALPRSEAGKVQRTELTRIEPN